MNIDVLSALHLQQWSLRTSLAVELFSPPKADEQLLLQRILSIWELSTQDILCYYGEPANHASYLKCWSFVGETFAHLNNPQRLILPTLQELLISSHKKKFVYHDILHFGSP